MVRIMAAVLVAVGRGDRPPEAAGFYLEHPEAYPADTPAPAHGLYFIGARYDRIAIPPAPDFLPH